MITKLGSLICLGMTLGIASGFAELLKIPGQREGVFHLAEKSDDGQLVLNADNGFFDKGKVRAIGKGAPKEKQLISASFEALEFLGRKKDAAARWYLFADEMVELKVTLEFVNPKAGDSWVLTTKLTNEDIVLKEGQKHQEILISIGRGKQEVVLRRKGAGEGSRAVRSLRFKGPGVKSVSLLRARWRPAAIHTRYHAEGCPDPVMWIFESRSASVGSNYSPMTTAFGYFGATFGADQRASGGVNFSMWALSQKGAKGKMPSLSVMPHLLATGNPKAEFGGFGHEGSGVKIRNWIPYSHHPQSVIQALRVEKNGMYHTYYGYLFDERVKKWILYAVGNKVPRKNSPLKVRASSFCEVPGPPQVERTGDVERVMERRGWFADDAGKIFPVDRMTTKGRFQNHDISMSQDHWFQMKTGGLDFREVRSEVKSDHKHPLPEYLHADVFQGLYQLPAEIGEDQVIEVDGQSAQVAYEISRPGTEAKGEIWFGEVDAITFVPRKLHGTEKGQASEDLFAKNRLWARSSEPQKLVGGKNLFQLRKLKPKTTYYYRLYLKNEEGQCWAAKSGTFTTK